MESGCSWEYSEKVVHELSWRVRVMEWLEQDMLEMLASQDVEMT